jgi:hypothetical protein
MINIKTTAVITATQLKKLITEYMEQHTGHKVTSVFFNVGTTYDPFDREMGVALTSVDVTFDPKPEQTSLRSPLV